MIFQKEIMLPPLKRGVHLIDKYIYEALPKLPKAGMLNIFVKHTSAAISINENADPSVRDDMEQFIERLVPENLSYFTHIFEGSDDMPSHIKSSLIGSSVNIPITDSALNLGTWQGIYFFEFRNRGGARKLILTITQ